MADNLKQIKDATSIPVRGTGNLRPHPKADDAPSPDPEEYEELLQDIERRGVQVPLDILEDGTVLDGRTRLQVAIALGIQIVPVRVIDPPDPYDYMILAAATRRHLSKEQRAALYVLSPSWKHIKAEAAERAKAGVAAPDANSSAKKAAEKLGVGKTVVDEASGLAKKAPELLKAVADGKLSMGAATAIVKDPKLHAKVKAGTMTPEAAAKTLKTEDQLAKEHDIKRLRTNAPDLAEAMERKELSLKGALRILDEREEELAGDADGTTNGKGLPTKALHSPGDVIPRQLHEAIQAIRQAPPRAARTRMPDVIKAMLSAGKPWPKNKDGLRELRSALEASIEMLNERLEATATLLLTLEGTLPAEPEPQPQPEPETEPDTDAEDDTEAEDEEEPDTEG